MNKKGFVLMETLVVTVFSLFIFSILYNNIVPLLGRYNEIRDYNDLDTTYDLYHIRKFLRRDSMYVSNIRNSYGYQKIECNNEKLSNQEICYSVFDALEIEPTSDELIYLNRSSIEDIKRDTSISTYVRDYLNYINPTTNILILQHNGYVSYLNS